MSYPRVIALHVGDLRPILSGHASLRDGREFNGTDLVSVKFFMQNLKTLAMKIDGAACTIATANPLLIEYAWAGTDTDTAARYASWFIGYWQAGNQIPQTFVGPEIRIFSAGSRLVF